jgi:hypothetical protein
LISRLQGQRYKLNYDGMYHFDVPKTRQYDTGKIEVIARNSAGEALATTELEVVERRDDYRGVLKNSPRRKFLQKTIINCRFAANIKKYLTHLVI